jgi:hypothetical protein
VLKKDIRYVSIILILALNCIDLIITVNALSVGYSEANPLFSGDAFSKIQFQFIKIIPLAICLFAIAYVYRECKKIKYSLGIMIADIGLITMTVVYSLILFYNALIILGVI